MHELVMVNGAADEVDSIMKSLESNPYDYWLVGGRFTGWLDKYDPIKDPRNYIECSSCASRGPGASTCSYCNGTGKIMRITLEHDGDTQRIGDVDWKQVESPCAFVDGDVIVEQSYWSAEFHALVQNLRFEEEFRRWLFACGPDGLVTVVDCHL